MAIYDLVTIAAIVLAASFFTFIFLELKSAQAKCEILQRKIDNEYSRGFADGYDAAHDKNNLRYSETSVPKETD